MNQSKSKLLDIGLKMPPLYHKLPADDFDIKKSETVQWLINQPEVLMLVWNQFKQSGRIFYDFKTGTWQGLNYNGD